MLRICTQTGKDFMNKDYYFNKVGVIVKINTARPLLVNASIRAYFGSNFVILSNVFASSILRSGV